MSLPTLDRDGDVFVLDLGDGDNRFDGDTVPALHAALDEVAAATGPGALVTTASGKIWHNGLDLDHVASLGDDMVAWLGSVQHCFARLLTLPVPSVAALVGHTFAGGAMLAMAHDERIMRADRGYLCLPEVDLGMTFTPGMEALLDAKLPQPAKHRLGVLGERVGGPDALALGVVDAVAGDGEVLDAAMARAAALAPKAGSALVGLRANFYRHAIAANTPD